MYKLHWLPVTASV